MRAPQSLKKEYFDSDSERVLRIAEVMHRTGISRSTIHDLMSKREFPASFSIGTRAVGWLESEIAEFISARAAARQSV
jgi:prophage regulatory protein